MLPVKQMLATRSTDPHAGEVRLAIMQPYFLPYIGYFQLMAGTDKFVVLDDVHFINRGWINRNRIAVGGKPHWWTIPLVNATQNRLINEIEIAEDTGWKRKMLRMLELSYGRSEFAADTLALAREIVEAAHGRLSSFLFGQLHSVAAHLALTPTFVLSSEAHPKRDLTGQDRIIDICQREGAATYVNLPGGRDLYRRSVFVDAGIELLFLEPNLRRLDLRHNGGAEGPTLSIVDLLMLNPVTAIHRAAASMFQLSET